VDKRHRDALVCEVEQMIITTGTKIGAYEILAPLSKGGMGEVYRAKDSRLEREVAIKVLPADFANKGTMQWLNASCL